MRRRTLSLTPAARQELVQVRNRGREPAYLRECCAALLKLADGWSLQAVARAGLHQRRHRTTVAGWLTKYEQGGLAALRHRPRGHRRFSPSAGGRAGADRAPGADPARGGAPPLAPR